MARAIPTYQRQILPSGVQGAATGGMAGTDGSSPLAQALQNVGQAGMNVARTLQQRENEIAQNRSAVDVANVLSQGDVQWQEDFTNRAKAWKVGDEDIRTGLGKDYDKWRDESAEKFQTIESKSYFLKQTAASKARLMENAFSYQQKATTDKLNVDSVIGQQADENVVYADPTRMDDVFKRRTETILARTDLTEAQKTDAAFKYKNALSMAAERGQMERDPLGWYKQRFGEFRPQTGTSSLAGSNAATDKLWAAQLHQESGGDQSAVSPKGAIGVAQIMPGTGPEAAKLAGLPWDPEKLKNDAAYNEKLGRAYMDKQLETFGGDVPKALAAYNMGPGSAAKGNGVAGLVAKYGEDWLAHAPQETQDYVKNIMAKASGSGAATETRIASTASSGGESVTMTMNDNQPASFSSLDYQNQIELKHASETKIRQMEAQATSTLDATLRDASSMHANGQIDPFNLTQAQFDFAYGDQGREKYQAYQESRLMARDINQFQTMTPDEITANLKADKAQLDSLSDTGGVGYKMAESRLTAKTQSAQSVVQRQQDDPQAYAAQVGLSPAQPIDMTNTDALGKELAGRVSTAAMMAQKYKTPYALLTKPEAAAMTQAMATMPTAARVEYLETMRKSVQDPGAYRSLMQQIAPDSPVTAVAGSILLNQQFVQPGGYFGTDAVFNPKAVATTILQGEGILNPTEASKKLDGRGGNFPMPQDKEMQQNFADFVGAAFAGDPVGYSAAYQAYRAYYAGKASERGILSPDLDSEISQEALTAVTGGISDFNGRGEVLKPWGMDEGDFETAVTDRFRNAIETNGYQNSPTDNLDAYALKQVRPNQYLLVNGLAPLKGKDGEPIVLDVSGPLHKFYPPVVVNEPTAATTATPKPDDLSAPVGTTYQPGS